MIKCHIYRCNIFKCTDYNILPKFQLRLSGDVVVWESFLDQKHIIIPCIINLHAIGHHSFQLIVSNFSAEPSVDASYMIIHDIECRRALAKMKYNADGQCRY